jgi:uncharacterized YigZ family protein
MVGPRTRYVVPAASATAEIEVKRSRFLCLIERVESRDEAREVVAQAKKAHPDARHHCAAFVIGANGETEHSSDDGEPAGTAGAPMLEALRGSDVRDVLAVVTRWFGGTLLGPGGLVRAYSDAVRAGLSVTQTRERILVTEFAVSLDHSEIGRAESDLRARGVSIVAVEYAAQARLIFGVSPGESAPVLARLSELTNGRVRAQPLGERWVDGALLPPRA